MDYARAICSIGVICGHLRVFGTSLLFDPNRYHDHVMQISDILNFNIINQTVPVFFLVALFLQFEKQLSGKFDFRGRIERLLYMYGFWVCCVLVLYRFEDKLQLVWPNSIQKLFLLLISGANSPFYFLASLILLTILSYWCKSLRFWYMASFGILSFVLLIVNPTLVMVSGSWQWLVAFWNPLNFLVYVFLAGLVAHWLKSDPGILHSRKLTFLMWFLVAGYGLSACLEWIGFRGMPNYVYDGYAFPPFARPSIAIGALLVLLFALRMTRPQGIVIRTLSTYSLGVYCLHGFVGYYLKKTSHNADVALSPVLELAITLGGSLLLSALLRRAFQKGLI